VCVEEFRRVSESRSFVDCLDWYSNLHTEQSSKFNFSRWPQIITISNSGFIRWTISSLINLYVRPAMDEKYFIWRDERYNWLAACERCGTIHFVLFVYYFVQFLNRINLFKIKISQVLQTNNCGVDRPINTKHTFKFQACICSEFLRRTTHEFDADDSLSLYCMMFGCRRIINRHWTHLWSLNRNIKIVRLRNQFAIAASPVNRFDKHMYIGRVLVAVKRVRVKFWRRIRGTLTSRNVDRELIN
jgi:hypothetical protein